MRDQEPKNNSEIKKTVSEMYDDCRANIDSYDSPSGIKLQVGGVDWAVVYWPGSSTNNESLSLLRDWQKLDKPVSYRILTSGYTTKNDKIAERIIGGVFFDPTGEELINDKGEVFILQAIVRSAHQLRDS